MTRFGYSEEHEEFRRTARSFFDKELEPQYKSYAARGGVDKEFWKKAGNAGLLGLCIPEEFGGPGGDFTYSVILAEELGASVGSAYTGSTIMADVATYILMGAGTPEQKRKYAAGILSGEISQAMPLTEPDAGSDPTAIKTTAVRDGKDWVINGEKYFISNGTSADVLYVVAKTDPTKRGSGMSIIIVDANTPGVTRHKIPMVGWAVGDTGALSFSNVRVPLENLLGQEGQAMKVLMSTFIEDRLQISGRSVGAASTALRLTVDYVKQRKAFGQRVADFQNTQFVLADLDARIAGARAFTDACMLQQDAGTLDGVTMAQLKLVTMELQGEVLDKCLQFFGGYGYMREYPIARAFVGEPAAVVSTSISA